MVDIKAIVRQQKLSVTVPTLVSGTVDFISISLKADSSWNGYSNITCFLTKINNIAENKQIGLQFISRDENWSNFRSVPFPLSAGMWEIWFMGTTFIAPYSVGRRVTTETKIIEVGDTGYLGSEMTEEQLNLAMQAYAKADDVWSAWKRGEMQGPEGPQGPKGDDAPTDYMLVQDEQPTSPTNKLWINPSDSPITLPTPDDIDTDSLYDPIIPLKEYNASWEGTDSGVTITKVKNNISFSGTHESTYHYVSLLGDQLYTSTGNNSTSIPDAAFSIPFKAGLFYRLAIMALSTTTNSGFNQLSLRKKDGTIVANLFVPPTTEGSVKTIEFKSDGTPLALVMLLTGNTTGLSFKVILDEIQAPVQTLVNGEYINIAPYIKNWNNGYISTNGTVGSQTSNKEIVTGYIPITGTVLRFFVSINTEILNGRDVYPMIGYYSDSAFISRWNNTPTYTEINGENTLIYFASSIPANATRTRLSLRTFGDSNIKICCFDSKLSLGASLINKPRLPSNAENHAQWLEDQLIGNVIKPHVGVRSINHRGWLNCPENTLVAYKQSKLHGFEAGECDVRFTSDNVPVLLHDPSINRTARNADGTEISSTVNIASITYEQALTYDFGIYKGNEYAGTKIPTLAQYCELCRNISLSPYIEIEAGATWAQCNIIADTVIASGIVDEVTFISSDNTALKNVQKRIPQARYGVLPWTYSSSYLELAVSMFNGKSEIFLDIAHEQITSAVVSECAAANVPIEAWVTDSSTIRSLNPYVTGFTSNGAVANDVLFKLENPGEKTQREINAEKADTAIIAPSYNPQSTYTVGAYCIHDGGLYVCNTAISTAEAWTAAHWTGVTVAGIIGNIQSVLASVVSVT